MTNTNHIKKASFLLSVLLLMGMGMFKDGWVGAWDVTDTQDRPYVLTLMKGGEAMAKGSQNMKGSWYEKEGKAFVTWETGWRAILWRDGDKIQKDAFEPSQNFDDETKHRSPAMPHS